MPPVCSCPSRDKTHGSTRPLFTLWSVVDLRREPGTRKTSLGFHPVTNKVPLLFHSHLIAWGPIQKPNSGCVYCGRRVLRKIPDNFFQPCQGPSAGKSTWTKPSGPSRSSGSLENWQAAGCTQKEDSGASGSLDDDEKEETGVSLLLHQMSL